MKKMSSTKTILESPIDDKNDIRRVSLATSIDDEPLTKFYESKKKGIAILISNKKFLGKETNRFGAEFDLENLEKCFKALGFKIEKREDRTGEEIKQDLEYFSKVNYDDIDCLVCFVMSYGNPPANVYGTDNKTVLFDMEVKRLFKINITLVGKPKLFFIQACKAEIRINSFEILETKADTLCMDKLIKKAPDSDFLFSYCNVEDYISSKDSKKGTWYIQAIVYIIEKYADSQHVITMLKKVNKKVFEKFNQTPTLDSTLRYNFYFKTPNLKPKKVGNKESIIGRNLLKNGNCEEKFMYWCLDKENEINDNLKTPDDFKKIIEKYENECIYYTGPLDWSKKWANSIDGWAIENSQNHSYEKLKDIKDNNRVILNFVSSYFVKGKFQVIDLEKEAVAENYLESNKLKIDIFENYTRREDCGCDYFLKVFFLSKDYELLDSLKHTEKLEKYPCPWKSAIYQIKLNDFKKPIRFIIYYHAGKDHKCWSGFYGTKITNGSVTINKLN